jgi:rhodanese-related sulfurtransferase
VADEGSARQVTAAEAIALAAAGTMLIDVREQWEWDRGHAPQAALTPMSSFADYVPELPTDADILVICHSGARSSTVVAALVEGGYAAVDVLGGMTAWQHAGGPVVGAAPQTPSA